MRLNAEPGAPASAGHRETDANTRATGRPGRARASFAPAPGTASAFASDDAPMAERVAFRGDAGLLVGELAYPTNPARFACLLFNPHPLMGGSVENNVIRTLALGLAAAGSVTLRFDYGGVGHSEGPAVDVAAAMAEFWKSGRAPQDSSMLRDGAAALKWLRHTTHLPVVLIGYSFGAYVLSKSINPDVVGVIVISPTLRHHDLSSLVAARCPRLMIYSDNDFATPRDLTESWISGLPGESAVLCVQGGEHFFRGAEQEVLRSCADFVAALPTAKEPR